MFKNFKQKVEKRKAEILKRKDKQIWRDLERKLSYDEYKPVNNRKNEQASYEAKLIIGERGVSVIKRDCNGKMVSNGIVTVQYFWKHYYV